MASPKTIARLVLQRVVLSCAVVLLAVVATGFLISSLLLGLLEVTSPPLASLLTAMTVGLAALVIALAARRHHRRRPLRAGVEDLLPAIRLMAERHSWSALAASLALGAVAELTSRPSTRRSV